MAFAAMLDHWKSMPQNRKNRKKKQKRLLHLVTGTSSHGAGRTERSDKTQIAMVAGVAVGSRVQISATKVKAAG